MARYNFTPQSESRIIRGDDFYFVVNVQRFLNSLTLLEQTLSFLDIDRGEAVLYGV